LLGVAILAITFLVTKPGDKSVDVSTPAPAATTSNAKSAQKGKTAAHSGTTATAAARPARPKQPAVVAGAGLPTDVARALNQRKVVVLFFYEPAASDDQATRAAVRAVRQAARPGAGVVVSLFQDTVAHISNYRRVVGSLGISQSPAMVVIDRSRKAQLLQGYLDSGTIKQTVRDAV
jgi:hypothetical protein